jgi:N-methylhydantoinase A/oxoprolinase/acetone carboxylase beta subunit
MNTSELPQHALSFDVGGTFTDFTLVDLASGSVIAEHKELTDAEDPSRSSLAGWRELIAQGALDPAALQLVVHATTLVTNAVIERKGARTAFLTTYGFRDLLTFGREQMYDIYDLFAPLPEPLVPDELRIEVDERVTRDGTVLKVLDVDRAVEAVQSMVNAGATAIAIGFLHSYLNPDHEARAAARISEAFPDLDLSLSCKVAPIIGEYERFSTTIADAYVKRLVRVAVGGLVESLHREGLAADCDVHIMTSSGGIVASSDAFQRPIRLLESGPAAGALAAAFHGKLAGRTNVLSLDMGGTTAKACLIEDGKAGLAPVLEAARVDRFKPGSGLPVIIPVVDLIEIGAGGGSIARVDEMGLLKVGPESAGAAPGPACYGLGGTLPTVTDANLILGYLSEDGFLGGRMELDRTAAANAIGGLAAQLGLDMEATAWGINRVANEAMAAAARIHAIEKNRDPRAFSLLAFGGAGPVHASAVARILGTREVIFPPGAGVASALGCLVAPLAIALARTLPGRLDTLDWEAVDQLYQEMETEAMSSLAAAGVARERVSMRRSVDLKLSGQYHELTVDFEDADHTGPRPRLEEDFVRLYSDRYGRMLTGLAIEATTWRLNATGPEGAVQLQAGEPGTADPSSALRETREARFLGRGDGLIEAPVYLRSSLRPGMALKGPAIVEEANATLVLQPGDAGVVNPYGAIVVAIGEPQ